MKLTDSELEQIKSAQEEFAKAKLHLADLELSKQSVFRQISDMQVKYGEVERALIEKYGEDATINTSTGVVTHKGKQ